MVTFGPFKPLHWLVGLTLLSGLTSGAERPNGVQDETKLGGAEITTIDAYLSAAMDELQIPGITLGIAWGVVYTVLVLIGRGSSGQTS